MLRSGWLLGGHSVCSAAEECIVGAFFVEGMSVFIELSTFILVLQRVVISVQLLQKYAESFHTATFHLRVCLGIGLVVLG